VIANTAIRPQIGSIKERNDMFSEFVCTGIIPNFPFLIVRILLVLSPLGEFSENPNAFALCRVAVRITPLSFAASASSGTDVPDHRPGNRIPPGEQRPPSGKTAFLAVATSRYSSP
jgi:hypothetical protein